MTTDKKTQCAEKLAQSRTNLKNLLASLTEEQWQTAIVSEGQTWTAADIVAHLLENEKAMSIHVHKIRQGKVTVPEGFDLQKWNAGLKNRISAAAPAALLEDLEQARARTLAELETIRDDEWNLEGRHPLHGPITIEQYYITIAGHDDWHANDIKRALKL